MYLLNILGFVLKVLFFMCQQTIWLHTVLEGTRGPGEPEGHSAAGRQKWDIYFENSRNV